MTKAEIEEIYEKFQKQQEESMKKYQVYCAVTNYTILLDDQNKISHFQKGHSSFANFAKRKDILDLYSSNLQWAFSCMLIREPKKFQELYQLLKKNDPEMFVLAEQVVNNIIDLCVKL